MSRVRSFVDSEGAHALRVPVRSDADYIPAVEHVQAKGLKVLNAAWGNSGHHLRRACWASFLVDGLRKELCQ